MANRTVPAAAEGMSKPDFSDLEGIVCNAALAASVARGFIMDRMSRTSGIVELTRTEIELFEYALNHSEAQAAQLRTDFYALLEVSQ